MKKNKPAKVAPEDCMKWKVSTQDIFLEIAGNPEYKKPASIGILYGLQLTNELLFEILEIALKDNHTEILKRLARMGYATVIEE